MYFEFCWYWRYYKVHWCRWTTETLDPLLRWNDLGLNPVQNPRLDWTLARAEKGANQWKLLYLNGGCRSRTSGWCLCRVGGWARQKKSRGGSESGLRRHLLPVFAAVNLGTDGWHDTQRWLITESRVQKDLLEENNNYNRDVFCVPFDFLLTTGKEHKRCSCDMNFLCDHKQTIIIA